MYVCLSLCWICCRYFNYIYCRLRLMIVWVLMCTSSSLRGSETVCESVTGGAEKAADSKSSEEQINSHSVKVSRCLLLDWRLCAPCPPHSLLSPRWCPSHPDHPAPLRWAAEEWNSHSLVCGQQGLPLRLDSVLEAAWRQQHLGGQQEPSGAGEGRPLQLEQHPEPQCTALGGRDHCHLPGHPGLPGYTVRDTEERPVFLVLSWSLGLCYCFDSQSAVCLRFSLSVWLSTLPHFMLCLHHFGPIKMSHLYQSSLVCSFDSCKSLISMLGWDS